MQIGCCPRREICYKSVAVCGNWCCVVVADGLLSQEREDLVERVAYLEKKVTLQEDEIVCLKSALADVIRRLAAVEAGM